MIKTTQWIFNIVMLTIEIFPVSQALCVFVYMIIQQISNYISSRTTNSTFGDSIHYYSKYELHPWQTIITWCIPSDIHLLQTDMVTQ
jgi:hypothetical protein